MLHSHNQSHSLEELFAEAEQFQKSAENSRSLVAGIEKQIAETQLLANKLADARAKVLEQAIRAEIELEHTMHEIDNLKLQPNIDESVLN